MSSEYFKKMLKAGQNVEDKAIKLIEAEFKTKCTYRQTEKNYKLVHYDFETDDGTTYEVKADFASVKTNNFFIEYEGYGKKSGLSISTATYHILNSDKLYYIIDTNVLKQLLNTGKYRRVSTNTETKGFIIPVSVIKENCHKIIIDKS